MQQEGVEWRVINGSYYTQVINELSHFIHICKLVRYLKLSLSPCVSSFALFVSLSLFFFCPSSPPIQLFSSPFTRTNRCNTLYVSLFLRYSTFTCVMHTWWFSLFLLPSPSLSPILRLSLESRISNLSLSLVFFSFASSFAMFLYSLTQLVSSRGDVTFFLPSPSLLSLLPFILWRLQFTFSAPPIASVLSASNGCLSSFAAILPL